MLKSASHPKPFLLAHPGKHTYRSWTLMQLSLAVELDSCVQQEIFCHQDRPMQLISRAQQAREPPSSYQH